MASPPSEAIVVNSSLLSPIPGYRDEGNNDTKGLVYKRSSVQLRSVDQTHQSYVRWISKISEDIHNVLLPLLRDVRFDFSKDDPRFRVLEDLRSRSNRKWEVKDDQLHVLHRLLNEYMTAVENSRDAAEEILATIKNEGIFTGLRANGKDHEPSSSSKTARASLFRTLRTSRPNKSDSITAFTKFLEVVNASKLGLEVMRSSMNLIEILEGERVQLQQALVAQPKHLEYVKELPSIEYG
jgi:hypothetical protein